jgi:hypothetical protein
MVVTEQGKAKSFSSQHVRDVDLVTKLLIFGGYEIIDLLALPLLRVEDDGISGDTVQSKIHFSSTTVNATLKGIP